MRVESGRFVLFLFVIPMNISTAIKTVTHIAALAPIVILSILFIKEDGEIGFTSLH
jgi:hypothetical protein